MSPEREQALLELLAQSIRVHCKAQTTRMEVPETWVMELARNQLAALRDFITDEVLASLKFWDDIG